jgi:hypothetical protein
MESWVRVLKIFVVTAGIVLFVGTATLIGLLVRGQVHDGDVSPDRRSATLALPAGSRIEQAQLDGSRLLLVLRGTDQQQYLALVNPTTGERLSLLRVVPEAP